MRILLIGEAPSASYDPSRHARYSPLYPLPKRATGGRLYALTGLPSMGAYLRTFQRVNLFDRHPGLLRPDTEKTRSKDAWPAKTARERAQVMSFLLTDRTVIFVGRRVATAFGFKDTPWCTWRKTEMDFHGPSPAGNMRYAVIPHTSPRCHFYNTEDGKETVRRFFKDLLTTPEETACAGVGEVLTESAAPPQVSIRKGVHDVENHHVQGAGVEPGGVGSPEHAGVDRP